MMNRLSRKNQSLRPFKRADASATLSHFVPRFCRLGAFLIFLISSATVGANALPTVASARLAENWASVSADFDGDHRLDRARLSPSESGYEIDIIFAAQPRPILQIHWLGLPGEAVQIVSCDVDFDGDQDLVATQVPAIFPLALWLGDGQGHFSGGDRTVHSSIFASQSEQLLATNEQASGKVCLFQTGPLFALAQNDGFSVVHLPETPATFEFRRRPPQYSAQALHPRAPPSQL